ncbi:unnamed protein product [Lupinus luteus]|uniref:Uncharacterized protein n=1 Tax=Lupinus luteus TaxID=3873 RepID=A0AAV1VQ74_LUPLU
MALDDVNIVLEEEVMQEVMDENMIEIMKESLEGKMVENGEVEGEKMDVMEENVVLGMEKSEVNKEKRKELEEIMMENGEVDEGKIVIIDDGVDMEALLGDSDDGEGGEGNGDNGGVVRDFMEVENDDIFSIDINGEGDEFPSWNQWKFEEEQKWFSVYPYWENENSALNFWDVESPTNDWVVSLWQL